MKEYGRNLFVSVVGHGVVGSLAGYLFLHPASVFIHYFFEDSTISLPLVIEESFSAPHSPMALRKLPYLVDSSKVEFSAFSCMYSAGVLSPRESWGRSSLYSIIHQ
jgi:hypothetical protein